MHKKCEIKYREFSHPQVILELVPDSAAAPGVNALVAHFALLLYCSRKHESG